SGRAAAGGPRRSCPSPAPAPRPAAPGARRRSVRRRRGTAACYSSAACRLLSEPAASVRVKRYASRMLRARTPHSGPVRELAPGGLGDQLGAQFLPQKAGVQEEVVLVGVRRLAVKVGGEEVGAAAVAQTDLFGRLIARQPQPLAHVGDAVF